MDIQNKKEALIAEIEQFKEEAMKMHFIEAWSGSYKTDPFSHAIDDENNIFWMKAQAHQLWQFWQAAKAQVPEGFVLVPESKISHFWQDNDEPENLCIDASGFNSLGDCIDDGEVMIVNKFTQANISKQKMFGVWCTCEPKPFTRFIKEFKLFDTQEEAEQAMIEAQEQAQEQAQ